MTLFYPNTAYFTFNSVPINYFQLTINMKKRADYILEKILTIEQQEVFLLLIFFCLYFIILKFRYVYY